MEDHRLNRLSAWLTENGGYLQDGVKLAHSPSAGYHMQALHNFDSSQPVVQVPRQMTISLSTTSFARSLWPQGFLDCYNDEPYVITRFLLLDEYLHGAMSWWFPYIALLPTISKDSRMAPAPFNTPLWYSDEALDWLQGTSLYTATLQRIKLWRKEYDTGRSFLTNLARYNEYSWPLYKWAATILSSRCFPDKPPEAAKTGNEHLLQLTINKATDAHHKTASYPVLVPVLDLANHCPKANATWIINEDGYTLYTTGTIEPGRQIYNNYGAKGNEELLMGYGFTIPNNPADCLALRFTIPECPQKACAREMIRCGKDSPLGFNSAQLDLSNHPDSEFMLALDVFYLQDGVPIPTALFETVRLTVSNEREMRELFDGRDHKSCRSSVQTRGQLLLALVRRLSSLNTSPALSRTEASNFCQEIAQEYAHGQFRILNYHIRQISEDLLRVQQSFEFWTLNDLLQHKPNIMKPALRNLARTVCGTRDSIKLKAKGLEDTMMAIFICLSWLTLSKDHIASEEWDDYSGSDETTTRFEQWHQFILSTYCPPPNVAGDCKGVACFCTPRKPQPWSFPDSGSASDWNHKIATAYALVQRYFLLSDTEPIFRSRDLWTKPFLQWAFEIWSAEAMILPVSKDINSTNQISSTEQESSSDEEKGLYLEVLSVT